MSFVKDSKRFVPPELRPVVLPPPDELARRGFTFERVDQAYESPVRLRQAGFACGIFPTRSAAAQLIKTLVAKEGS
jgi:hypothetical protein